MWVNYPENKPTEPGYYMTYYFNSEENLCFYKAIYFSPINDRWCQWRPKVEWQPEVKGYVPASKNRFYCPCVEWVRENDIPAFEMKEENVCSEKR